MRLNMSRCKGFTAHRHGWGFVLDSIKYLHSSSGVLLDDFIEKTFSWDYYKFFHDNENRLPYNSPWIGIVHNPPGHPNWFDYENSIHQILKRPVFQESLRSCIGIIVLSNYLLDFLKDKVNVPIFSIYHPTELNVQKWNLRSFINNKKVVQVGYWLRRIDTITKVTLPNYEKIWLPSDYNQAMKKSAMEHNIRGDHHEDVVRKWSSVKIEKFLSNEDYDNMVSSSVILCNMYDASANNAVIEAIARESPIIVNKLPAVVEYLGEDYPLYIDAPIDEMLNMDRIVAAHKYLKNLDKQHISTTNFVKDFNKCLRLLTY